MRADQPFRVVQLLAIQAAAILLSALFGAHVFAARRGDKAVALEVIEDQVPYLLRAVRLLGLVERAANALLDRLALCRCCFVYSSWLSFRDFSFSRGNFDALAREARNRLLIRSNAYFLANESGR